MTLTVGSLFSGIGGIDLGLERAGMTVKWQSEIDPFACKVLKKHWPDIPNLDNIKEIDWSKVEPVDLIAGGYPCQPFSTAGKRQGENDPRHLWPYFRNAISAIRPKYALLENVRGHLTMGGTTVIGDLAQIGYDCEWQVVSAASVGAPHRRDRIIVVAHPNDTGIRTPKSKIDVDRSQKSKERQHAQSEPCRQSKNVANTNGEFLGKHRPSDDVGFANRIWRDNPRGQKANDLRQWWETEPDVGRVADGVPRRVDRLRGLGNAVVPQVAEYVGRLIMEAHNERPI
jgi:DNA (cytosine-5)-methyltransferase 1